MNDALSVLNNIENSMLVTNIRIYFFDDGSIFRLDKKCMDFVDLKESLYLTSIVRLALFKKFKYDFSVTDGFCSGFYLDIRVDYDFMEVLKFIKELLGEDFNGRVECKWTVE